MKRKVVFLINSLYGGGAEKVLQTLLKHIDKTKFDVTLYSLHKAVLNEHYPSDLSFRYIYGHGKMSDYLKTFIYKFFSPSLFYRLFIHGKYDTEVAFIEGYSTRIISGSTNRKSKKIAWVHIDLESNHWTDIAYKSREEETECYNRFDCVVAVSETVRKANEKLFPQLKQSMCLYNPIDSEDIIRKAKDLL